MLQWLKSKFPKIEAPDALNMGVIRFPITWPSASRSKSEYGKFDTVESYQMTEERIRRMPELSNIDVERITNKSISYIFENRGRRKLIFFLSGLGLDFNDFFFHHKEFADYDFLSPSVIGFQSNSSDFLDASLEVHAKVLAFFLNHFVRAGKYERVVLVGFSVGADLNLMMRPYFNFHKRIENFVLLDPNICDSTTFISRRLAEIEVQNGSSNLIEVLQAVASASPPKRVDRWVNLHTYLIKIALKFDNSRLRFLSLFASRVAEKYSNLSQEKFVEYLTQFQDQFKTLCLFSTDDLLPTESANLG